MSNFPGWLKTKELTPNDIDAVIDLQKAVIDALANKDLLRENTEEMFLDCINHGTFIGVFTGEDELVAFGISIDARGTDEDLSIGLATHTAYAPINMKNTMVHPKYRGLGLQRSLLRELADDAAYRGYTHGIATVSPVNKHSLINLLKEDYEYDHIATKYGGKERFVMVKTFNE